MHAAVRGRASADGRLLGECYGAETLIQRHVNQAWVWSRSVETELVRLVYQV